jgi:hypothetical protein
MSVIDCKRQRDLRKDPILLINKRLNKYRDSDIPVEKKEKVKNLLSNTNLYEVIQEIKKEKVTKE